ncbi:MAG TPA: hypothetical protein VGL35_08580 [Rhizomicrobium sp.]|jgi:hypothetical protein
MRVLAILAVSAAALPLVALADPAPAQAPAPMATQAPVASAPTVTAQATPAQTAPAPIATTSGENLDQVVCRSSPPPTGTRLGATRECHTQRVWNQRQEDSQRMLSQTQMGGLQSTPPGH